MEVDQRQRQPQPDVLGQGVAVKSQIIATAPITNWPSSFSLPGSPFLFFFDSLR